MMNTRHIVFSEEAVENKFLSYPTMIKPTMLRLRQLIFTTAQKTNGVGKLTETLKWGEPSYLTSESKSGSTVRIDWKEKNQQYGIYFNCKTRLIEQCRAMFSDRFEFQGNRAIVFADAKILDWDALSECITLALTYYL